MTAESDIGQSPDIDALEVPVVASDPSPDGSAARGGSPHGPLLYLTIIDSLRDRIVSGEFPPGQRLPSEAELAKEFSSSRASVREALRVLLSQGLIATTRGSAGGSVVLAVNHRDVMPMLEQHMRHLVSTRGASEREMEEVQELVEVTAAWMAAARRSPVHLDRLRAHIPDIRPGELPTDEHIETNLRFHNEILDATGNRLLHLIGEPVSVIVNEFFRRVERRPEYYQQVLSDHRAIALAIESRDPDAARDAMAAHMRNLRDTGDGPAPRSSLSGLVFP